jgi:hypothetical protein
MLTTAGLTDSTMLLASRLILACNLIRSTCAAPALHAA